MAKELSEAQKRAIKKWDGENLKRFSVAMLTDDFDALASHVKKRNESRNRFINRAVRETIERDNTQESGPTSYTQGENALRE